MAFVILSTGELTESKQRTIGIRSLALGCVVLLGAMLAAGIGIGYGLRGAVATPPPGGLTVNRMSLDQPESRALIDRVGALSGRLVRLESEAATLARQLGVSPKRNAARSGPATPPAEPASPPAMATGAAAQDAEPSGGPLVPVTDSLTSEAVDPQSLDDYGIGLSQLEEAIERVEAELSLMADVATERSLRAMAFPNRAPLTSRVISSGFGVRVDPMTGRLARHTGLDFPAPIGTPILASAGGRVRAAGPHGAYGYEVEIDHGNGLVTRYGHVSRLLVRVGDLVMPQQKIALVGSTGRSTGPHLHFEVLRNGVQVEPRYYLAQRVGT